jgi:hypothetical protein
MPDLTSSLVLILLAVFLGAVLTLLGTALGGLLVFRTRRDSHEPLFQVREPKGDAFVSDDFPEIKPAEEDVVPSLFPKNEEFLRQLKTGKVD